MLKILAINQLTQRHVAYLTAVFIAWIGKGWIQMGLLRYQENLNTPSVHSYFV